MMNSDHPRFGMRMITLGGALMAASATVHATAYRVVFASGCLLTFALITRLAIELSIHGDERESDLEPRMRWMGLLNQFSLMVVFLGWLGFTRGQ